MYFLYDTINKKLKKIYSKIPKINCHHCHFCCGPIVWFEPEKIVIEDYMRKNKIKKVVWTLDEFKKNDMKCPYLFNDRCVIYDVRPIICRLFGVIQELKCELCDDVKLLTNNELDSIKKEFLDLIKETNGLDMFYGTHKIEMR